MPRSVDAYNMGLLAIVDEFYSNFYPKASDTFRSVDDFLHTDSINPWVPMR